jgi:hypothetical protein
VQPQQALLLLLLLLRLLLQVGPRGTAFLSLLALLPCLAALWRMDLSADHGVSWSQFEKNTMYFSAFQLTMEFHGHSL